MSARANAPVFQLHPSVTGEGLGPPSQVPVAPTSTSHGPTAANHSGIKRQGESSSYVEPYLKRRREDEYAGPSRSEADSRSQGFRSPDRVSQRSGSGNVKSMNRGAEEAERMSSPPTPPRIAPRSLESPPKQQNSTSTLALRQSHYSRATPFSLAYLEAVPAAERGRRMRNGPVRSDSS
jgi:hypothetical protein